jgi:hypothetical protein
VPGNQDVSNAIGYTKTLSLATARTSATYDHKTEKVFHSREVADWARGALERHDGRRRSARLARLAPAQKCACTRMPPRMAGPRAVFMPGLKIA